MDISLSGSGMLSDEKKNNKRKGEFVTLFHYRDQPFCFMHLSSPGPEEDDKSEGPGVANLQRDRASGNALIKMFNKIFLKICIILKQFRINRVKNKYA